eukprot:364305-Chlamydomonas_euryale.AAC.5
MAVRSPGFACGHCAPAADVGVPAADVGAPAADVGRRRQTLVRWRQTLVRVLVHPTGRQSQASGSTAHVFVHAVSSSCSGPQG